MGKGDDAKPPGYDDTGEEVTTYAAPRSAKMHMATQIQMDAYQHAISLAKVDMKKELARVKDFVLNTTYEVMKINSLTPPLADISVVQDLQPDRETDWHCKDTCEMKGCKLKEFATGFALITSRRFGCDAFPDPAGANCAGTLGDITAGCVPVVCAMTTVNSAKTLQRGSSALNACAIRVPLGWSEAGSYIST